MKLYYFVMDCGDGSASVNWLLPEHKHLVEAKADTGEDGWWYAVDSLESITLPDGMTPADIGLKDWMFWSPEDEE